jgi:uncharacterized protein HemX
MSTASNTATTVPTSQTIGMEAWMEQLLEEVLKEYGLVGLLIVIVITGPGFTWLKTRNVEVQVEDRARELVAEFARHERQRADRLEQQLILTLDKLEKAEDEVMHLKFQLRHAEQELAVLWEQLKPSLAQ